MSSSDLIRWGGLAAMVDGLLWFVGYAGFTKVLMPVISQLGSHVILGLAGLLTLLVLAGLFAQDAGRTALLGKAGYVLTFVGAAVFATGNLAEGVWLVEFGTRLFALGIMSLMIGMLLLGYGTLRARVLPPWSVWPLIVGWATFLPMASIPAVSGFTSGATNAYGLGFVTWALSSALLLGAGWVTLGYALWSQKDAPSQRPSRVN